VSIGALRQVTNILGGDIAYDVQAVVNDGYTCKAFVVHKCKGFGQR